MTIVLTSTDAADVGIANYCDLKQRVAEWLNRTDMDDHIPDFVRVAESKIRTDFRLRVQEEIAVGELEDGAFELPARFNEARRLVVGTQEMRYLGPDQFARLKRRGQACVLHFTIIGTKVHVLGGTDEDYTLDYWERFNYFGACGDTNWLLLNSPDVYLWASLEAGAVFLRDADGAAAYGGMYEAAKQRVQDRDTESRYAGPLVIPVIGSTA